MKLRILLVGFLACMSFTPTTELETAFVLYDQYEQFVEKSIKDRRFKHQDVLSVLRKVKGQNGIEVSKVGRSIEGRSINLVKVGNGPIKVLMWSQMHGDEPTATMTIMDLLNFFARSNDEFADIRAKLESELTIYFLPMLNPDGAERYQRRNALGVDLNRDALRLQTPEAATLKRVRDSLQADWGFNLHDQGRHYTVGHSGKNATFSFLAPAYNKEKNVNDIRQRAMQLITLMDGVAQEFLPGQVAKYDDAFEARAFGDNMQSWGTSTILVECGGLKGDPEKQYIRRIQYVMFLTALEAIVDGSYADQSVRDYYEIPQNTRNLMDLIVRNAQLEVNGYSFLMDLGFRYEEINYSGARRFYKQSQLYDLGDLSTYSGYQELDAHGMQIEEGKMYPEIVDDLATVRSFNVKELFSQGYTDIRVRKMPPKSLVYNLPFRLHAASKKNVANEVRLWRNPSFLLVGEDGRRKFAIVNGTSYRLEDYK